MKHIQLHISGKVQGVAYRASTKRKAESLGLKGRVKNLADGRVYAELEGDADQIKEMIDWCWEGPPFASVQDIRQKEGTIQGYDDFQILR